MLDIENTAENKSPAQPEMLRCTSSDRCGGCSLINLPYEEQLKLKQQNAVRLLGRFGTVSPIIGMEKPYFYRNKVHHVFALNSKKKPVSGIYASASHRVITPDICLIEDRISQDIIRTATSLIPSFRLQVYDEDARTGLLRHIMVRRGFSTGEIMVVLVCASRIFPSSKNFVKALVERHPEITTVILNVNEGHTSMVLGKSNITLYGPGFIKDRLCGLTFRLSPDSFYQINPVQTEILYKTAVSFASLTGSETIIDAYCGIGTIGLSAAHAAGRLIGAELNADAVRDAVLNARENKIKNARFVCGDAGDFMDKMVLAGEKADVIFMDPPRSGSTEKFIFSAAKMKPSRIVYVSCNPETLARDLALFIRRGYRTGRIQPVDMFPGTGVEHIETVVELIRG